MIPKRGHNILPINFIQDRIPLGLAMCVHHIITYPRHEVILESAFDYLV